ncbi:hydrogenase maturation nickel metallochaperone HypA [Sporichthya sp.]|uniref:hydrogenase maturation nickel metallochaperone HypA n=1 Tax=Sporichthya sp. TaxID=65475 RepID=UPI0017C3FB7E|nr:hydrogenase maturation nickel metallochaperone HypA [Sporichthya sp.]MBA3743647.1 hydrogenase maturation nickel metallochaperone HypA [Sporichthya sp.]
MHELSLCGAIADIAARRAGDRAVEVIHLEIGQLRQVVPDSLTFCWSMLTASTALDGSVLDVERVAARLSCRACAAEFGLTDSFTFACAACGGLDVAVLAGEEFVVTALEFAPA